MCPKVVDRIAKSVDPDQVLFSQTCLSENLGSLWYIYYFMDFDKSFKCGCKSPNGVIYSGLFLESIKWTASSEFGIYRLCEQRRFRWACASAQSRQNLQCSLIQAVNQEEPSDRKPDPWPLWMVGYAQLKFVMKECSKTQIRLTGPKCRYLNMVFKEIFTEYSVLFIPRIKRYPVFT